MRFSFSLGELLSPPGRVSAAPWRSSGSHQWQNIYLFIYLFINPHQQ